MPSGPVICFPGFRMTGLGYSMRGGGDAASLRSIHTGERAKEASMAEERTNRPRTEENYQKAIHAAYLILGGSTAAKAAEAIGVNKSTLSRWMRDPFWEKEIIPKAASENNWKHLAYASRQRLAALIEDKDPKVALKAVELALDNFARFEKLTDAGELLEAQLGEMDVDELEKLRASFDSENKEVPVEIQAKDST